MVEIVPWSLRGAVSWSEHDGPAQVERRRLAVLATRARLWSSRGSRLVSDEIDRVLRGSVITTDGDLRLPVELAEATGLQPGVEVDIEVTDSGILVRPREVAEREDAGDVEAAKASLRELERGGESVSWADTKRESSL